MPYRALLNPNEDVRRQLGQLFEIDSAQNSANAPEFLGTTAHVLREHIFNELVALYALKDWGISVFKIHNVGAEPYATLEYLNPNAMVELTRIGIAPVGASRADLYGRSTLELFGQIAADATNQNIHSVLRGEPLSVIREFMAPNGKNIYVSQVVPLLLEPSSGSYYYMTSHRNITGDELLQDTELVLQQARKLLADSEREAFLQSRGYSIAHDGRNLLSRIMMNAELLREVILSATERSFSSDQTEMIKCVDPIIEAGRLLTLMFRQIQEISDVSAKDIRNIDLLETMKGLLALECQTSYQRLIHDYSGRIILDIDSKVILTAQPHLIRIIISNIIKNGIDAIGEALLAGQIEPGVGFLKITARNLEGFTEIEVSDNGIGIDEKDLGNVFNKGFTTKKGKEGLDGGQGIGLADVRDFAHLQHGSISCMSSRGNGAVFLIRIPLKDLSEESDA